MTSERFSAVDKNHIKGIQSIGVDDVEQTGLGGGEKACEPLNRMFCPKRGIDRLSVVGCCLLPQMRSPVKCFRCSEGLSSSLFYCRQVFSARNDIFTD